MMRQQDNPHQRGRPVSGRPFFTYTEVTSRLSLIARFAEKRARFAQNRKQNRQNHNQNPLKNRCFRVVFRC